MKNKPEKIYLQIDADGETPEDFNELDGISWCDAQINKNDLVYIHISKYKKAISVIEKILKQHVVLAELKDIYRNQL